MDRRRKLCLETVDYVGWGERYNRTAVPVEIGFVVALAVVLALG